MAKKSREEKVLEVAQMIAEGGWSTMYSVADSLTDDQLDDWCWDEEEEDEE